LHGYGYNKVLTAFYIGYIVFEMPSSFACKYFGPGWWIPGMTVGFGIFSILTAFCTTIQNASAVRFLLGICEAGMLPGIAYFLSRWYTKDELVFRLSCYIMMSPLAGAFGGLLASAILTLDHVGGLRNWKMIFVIEGAITCGLGMIAFFTLTDRPETAMWLTPEEKDLAIARLKSERTATTEVLDSFTKKKILKGILNPGTLLTAVIFGLGNITAQGLAFFAPTIVKTIYPHNSVVSQQLHTVPPYVLGASFVLGMSYLSWKTGRYLIYYIITLPLTMSGYAIFLGTQGSDARYGATFLVATSAFLFGAISNALLSANVISDTARSAAIGTNVLFGNIGGLVSTWSYLPFDGPNYHIGNGLNLASTSCCFILSIVLLLCMEHDNKRRANRDVDAELSGLSIKDTQELDWQHPAFRWKP
jgi:MFS family permease